MMNATTHFSKEEHTRRLNEFKEVLNKITKEKGYTYYMLYDECDIDPLYMDSFLSGDNPNFPSPKCLKRMAEKSEGIVSYEELIKITGHQKIIFDKEVTQEIKRGDIYICDLGEGIGSEIYGIRPCLIIQNNKANAFSPMVIVVPITSQLKKVTQETHVLLNQNCGLNKVSIAQFEQQRSIDKSRLIEYVGKITGREMFDKVNKAYRIAGGCFKDEDTIMNDIIENIDNLEENNNEEISMFKKLYNNLFGSKSIETLFDK